VSPPLSIPALFIRLPFTLFLPFRPFALDYISAIWTRLVRREKRVDLIINSKENENIEEYLIEVKRKLDDDKVVEENEIDKDIDRLAEYLKYTTNKNARCFVLVVSQNDIPRKFVNDSFRAQKANSRDDFFTTERNNKYRVRMVRKAIPNLEEKEKYHQDRIERHSEEDDDNTYFNVKTVFSILLEVFV
jgi:hypothetical protein